MDIQTQSSGCVEHRALIEGQRALARLTSQLSRLGSLVKALELAALEEAPGTLYWPHLMEAIAGLVPDSESIDRILTPVLASYEKLLDEA